MTVNSESGFTLLEVVVSVAILSFSLAILLPSYAQSLERSRWAEARFSTIEVAEKLLNEVAVDRDWSALPKHGNNGSLSWSITNATGMKPGSDIKNVHGETLVLRISLANEDYPNAVPVELERTIWIKR